jgi:host factor-I protein
MPAIRRPPKQSGRSPTRPKSSRRFDTLQQSGKSGRAPEQTFEEAKYLKRLIENATPVLVKLLGGEEVTGVIEYYDQSFIRLTRRGEPNLFVFKHDIQYLREDN